MFLQNIKQACDIYGKIKKVIIIGGPEAPGRYILPPSLPPNTIQLLLFFIFLFLLFWPQIEVSPSTLRFTVLQHNDPAAAQDHCGRWRIRTRDLCPKSLVRYQRATTSPTNEWET